MADRYVYCAYGEDTEPLYVGVTFNVQQRMRDHKSSSSWHSLATRIDTYGPMPIADGYELERQLIAELQPTFNRSPGSKVPKNAAAGRMTVTMHLPSSTAAAIDQLANLEDRTRSQMVRILLAEAIKVRTKHG